MTIESMMRDTRAIPRETQFEGIAADSRYSGIAAHAADIIRAAEAMAREMTEGKARARLVQTELNSILAHAMSIDMYVEETLEGSAEGK